MSLSYWLQAIRPQTLAVSFAPVLTGQVLACQYAATDKFTLPAPAFWLLAILILCCALSLQIAVNLANDYYDARNGIDTPQRKGQTRVTAAGIIAPSQVLKGAIIALLIGIVSGATLVLLSHPMLIFLGVICVISVWAYSAGPYPLAHNALGEVVVFGVFGPIAVMGGFYAQHGNINALLWIPALQMGALAAAVMLVNNIRDINTDRQAGKTTVATLLGAKRARTLYVFIISLASCAGLLYFALSDNHAVGSYLTVIFAFYLVVAIHHRNGSLLNRQLANTTQFMLLSSVMFTLDILVFNT